MKILSIVGRGYYGSSRAVEPMYLYFTQPLALLGHEVEHFDHVRTAANHGSHHATELLGDVLAQGWDVVLYQHAPTPSEPIDTTLFRNYRSQQCIIAWNSDDDWQWPRTSMAADHFTWMVTTYPHVYNAHAGSVPNLLLGQWGCLGTYAEPGVTKDIDFSFAGWVYHNRLAECRWLHHHAGLTTYGKGSRLVRLPVPQVRGIGRIPFLAGPPISFQRINDIWNRTKVSFTPLGGGPTGEVRSLKSRLFDMGLSGSVVLTEQAPHIEDYFEPGVEILIYDGLEDCADQVHRLLGDEKLRSDIARAYRRRTLSEHLWTIRYRTLFDAAGLL